MISSNIALDKESETVSVAQSVIHASDLISLLDHYVKNKIKVLSLDCFDTIILRKTATPIDVFYTMQNLPVFSSLKLDAQLRIRAEQIARIKKTFRGERPEVTLQDIYLEHKPSLTKDELNALTQEEIGAEYDACYSFSPTIELILAAKKRGLTIIVISDTYFREHQLRGLLEKKLPKEAYKAINHVFCSSEFGIGKCNGVFIPIIKKLGIQPKDILHIGDNPNADFIAPKSLGLHAHQLKMQDPILTETARMQCLSAGFFDPAFRVKRPLTSLFHGVFASKKYSYEKLENLVGYTSAGPLMYAFGRFICDEAETLKQAGKSVKVLFLMRDAYLPSLVCEAISGKPIGHRVRISRFAAYASGFLSQKEIDHYLITNAGACNFTEMCKQFLLPEEITQKILKKSETANDSGKTFIAEINKPDVLDMIFKNSAKYRQRLFRHLEKEADIKRGDTLLFVDLGYTGNTQLALQEVFKKELDIDITGRYLLQLNIPHWQETRRGLIDPSCCDDKSISMLVSHIGLLEQICTSNDSSVIGYEEDGSPVFSESKIKKEQHEQLRAIQAQCVSFAKNAQALFSAAAMKPDLQLLRDTALIELGRLLFFPTKRELDCLQDFKFDWNLGTQNLTNVFDEQAGLIGLRRRGMFFMEKDPETMRPNYPAELRSAGIELVMMYMSQIRCNVGLGPQEFSHRRKNLTLLIAKGPESTQIPVAALPTYDGYFSVLTTIGNGDIQVGIRFGERYKWVEIESAEIISANSLFSSTESKYTKDASPYLAVNCMTDRGGGLFECENEAGMLLFINAQKISDANLALRVVFRPIVERATQ